MTWGSDFFKEVTPENKHDNGKSTICRCISYRKSGFSSVMLVFRGVSDQSEIQADQAMTAMEVSCMLFNELGRNGGSNVKNHPLHYGVIPSGMVTTTLPFKHTHTHNTPNHG